MNAIDPGRWSADGFSGNGANSMKNFLTSRSTGGRGLKLEPPSQRNR